MGVRYAGSRRQVASHRRCGGWHADVVDERVTVTGHVEPGSTSFAERTATLHGPWVARGQAKDLLSQLGIPGRVGPEKRRQVESVQRVILALGSPGHSDQAVNDSTRRDALHSAASEAGAHPFVSG
jgi:hypothetical protein